MQTGSMSFGMVKKYVRLYPDSEEEYDAAILEANRRFCREDHNLCW
jgi:hypothetical protein